MYDGLNITELARVIDTQTEPSPRPLTDGKGRVAFTETLAFTPTGESPRRSSMSSTSGLGGMKLFDRRATALRRRSSSAVTGTSDRGQHPDIEHHTPTALEPTRLEPEHVNGASPSLASEVASDSKSASSRWRVFGVLQRPAPEWRRKPSSVVLTASKNPKVNDSPAFESSAIQSPLAHLGAAFVNESAFELGRSYREGRLDAAVRRKSESFSKSGRRQSSAPSSGMRSAPIIGVPEDEVEQRVFRAIASTELACLEKYERALLEAAERNASLLVNARVALLERDAARDRLAEKNKRIQELEALVEALSKRFLIFGGAAETRNTLVHHDGSVDAGSEVRRPAYVPVLVDGQIPFESTRPTVVSQCNAVRSEDSKLAMRLREAIMAFERKHTRVV